MKRSLFKVVLGTTLSVATATSTYGAGQVYFDNYDSFGGIGAPIYMQDGTTPIAPSVFDISLYYQLGNVADPVATGTLVATTQSDGDGYYDGGVVTIPDYPDSGPPPGGISFQVLVVGTCPASGGGHSITFHLPSIATGNLYPTELDIPSFDVSATILSPELDWSISNGTVTITGYLGPGGNVPIPDTINGLPVTAIAPLANFRAGCGSYFSIEIPKSVTNIAAKALEGNVTAIEVDAANPVYSSVDGVLFDKHQTTVVQYPVSKPAGSYTTPNTVTTIASWAFYGCSYVTNLTIPNSVNDVEINAFDEAYGLTAISVDSANPFYSSANGVLFNKSQTLLIRYPGARAGTYTVPNSVTNIADYAFDHAYGLMSVSIPNSVISIGENAFARCSLTSLTIPYGVITMGSLAFLDNDNLTNVTISASVISIGNYPFENCSSLSAIMVDPLNPAYTSLDGVLFNKNQTTLIIYPEGKTGNYTVPDGVTNIEDGAFLSCNRLTSVTLGNGVTGIGSGAFASCGNLTSVTIPDSVTGIGSGAFSGCTRLASVTIGSSLSSISDGMFWNCTSLTSVTIPTGVTNIGDYAFAYCLTLTSVTIPDSVTGIGSGAFASCGNLTSVTIPNSVTSIGVEAFSGCTRLTSATIPDSVTSIGSRSFESCRGLASVAIGNSVIGIGDHAFFDCEGLTSVTIPDSVTSIGDFAFAGCGSLTNVTIGTSLAIPNSGSSIGVGAFEACTTLTSITIGNGVTSIGDYAFGLCSSLTSIYFKGDAPNIGISEFLHDNNATVYYLSGTTGWGPTFGGRPTALWTEVPVIQTAPQTQTVERGSGVAFWAQANSTLALSYVWYFNDTNFISCTADGDLELTNVQFSQAGVYTVVISNALGAVTSAPVMLNVITAVERRPVPAIDLMGDAGTSLNVEYTDALGPLANWLPLSSVNLTNPPQYCFDTASPLPPERFYRAWQTGAPSITPSLNLNMVPAITLTGNIGDKLRLDCINAIGPTDAWVTLDTVTLTNTSQLYFDTSSIGQPARLYRIEPTP